MTATVNFDYHFIEHVPPHYLYTVGATFSDGGKVVATVHEDLTVTRTPRIIIRLADGSRVINVDNIHDIIMRVRAVQPLPAGVDVSVYGEDGSLIGVVPLEGSFDIKQRAARPVDLPSHTVPTTPPTKPPVLDTWKVTHPDGMNIRSTPQVTADNSNLVGSVPTNWTFENDGSGATSTGYEWLHIYSGEHNGKNFAGNWIAVENRQTGYEFCKLDLGLEPPATGTVQLTGDLRLQTDGDGWTRLNNANRVGVNLRYAVKGSYDVDKHLQFLAARGIGWVRVYFAQEGKSLEQCLHDLKVVMDKCASLGLLVLVVITDSIRLSGMTITDDAPWHTESSLKHLNIHWYEEERWRGPYMSYLSAVVSTFKDHPALGLIDLMNEPGVYIPGSGAVSQAHTDAIQLWAHEASREVYRASDGEMGSMIGLINGRHIQPAGKDSLQHVMDFYGGLPYVQVVNGHVYSEAHYASDAIFNFEKELLAFDWLAAKTLKKAIWIGESGSWFENGGRDDAIKRLKSRHEMASGLCYWTFELTRGAEGDGFAASLPRDGQGVFDSMMAALAA